MYWDFEHIRQTQGHYPGEEVQLEMASQPGSSLIIEDARFLTMLHQIVPHDLRHLHDPRTRLRRIWLTIGAGLLALPLFWLLYVQAIPALTGPFTHLIPHAWEKRFGEALYTELAPISQRCTNSRLQEKLDVLLHTLISRVGPTPHDFRITIVDQETRNALALPGGHIIVYRGLLEKTKTPEELAGVLAHEIQHIVYRHGMRIMVQNMTLGFMIGALTGDISGIMAFVLEAAHALQTLEYGRKREEEADQKGIELLLTTGINPKGMLNFLEDIHNRMAEDSPTSLQHYLSTHPLPKDRLANLASGIEGDDTTYMSIFPLEDWNQLVGLCAKAKEG